MLLLSLSICVSAHYVDDFLLMLFYFLLLKDSLLAFLIGLILLTLLCFLGMIFATLFGCGFPALTSFLIAILLTYFSGFNDFSAFLKKDLI